MSSNIDKATEGSKTNSGPWYVWIDSGGTFTDCLAHSPAGLTIRAKVLSTGVLSAVIEEIPARGQLILRLDWHWNPGLLIGYQILDTRQSLLGEIAAVEARKRLFSLKDPQTPSVKPGDTVFLTLNEEAPILACRLLTGTPANQNLPAINLRLGTTRGTNAILERKGAKTAFITNTGLEESIEIGTQQRPDIFAVHIEKAWPLYAISFGIDGRCDRDGNEITPLDDKQLESLAAELKEEKIESVAINLLHSYKNPGHEERVVNFFRSKGWDHVSSGAELYPVINHLARSQTAIADAYLKPLLTGYYNQIADNIGGGRLHNISSAGNAVRHDLFHAKDALLSGPAGGVRAAAAMGQYFGLPRLLTFDMGGTSTDCARIEQNRYELTERLSIGDIELASPSVAIETVASGGGSICYVENGKLKVGPQSAGAYPGPACYGFGGPLTITDVNLLLGRISPASVEIPVNQEYSLNALEGVLGELSKVGSVPSPQDVLLGFIEIANEKMASAIRKISVSKGFDTREYALLSFGGAGGIHACAIADLLNSESVLMPYDAGIFSALGVGNAPVARVIKKQVQKAFVEVGPDLTRMFEEITGHAVDQLKVEGFSASECSVVESIASMRYKGQTSVLQIDAGSLNSLEEQFHQEYENVYGYRENLPVEVEGIAVTVEAGSTETHLPEIQRTSTGRPGSYTHPYFDPGAKIPFLPWNVVLDQGEIDGPAVIGNPYATYFVAPGWRCSVRDERLLVCNRQAENSKNKPAFKALDLELFTRRFQSIADDMGAQLQRTAVSVNVKHRLDFSCALLDPKGRLLANAAHIPVHLGSMGLFGRSILKVLEVGPGDIVVSNHPGFGGSHLPDISTIAGAYTRDGLLIGYVTTRAHHAEIGGKTPGSMPVDATSLGEEGVVIEPTYVVRSSKPNLEAIREKLSGGLYPSRNIEENIADIQAAIAATQRGIAALQQLVERYSYDTVLEQMQSIYEHAGEVMKDMVTNLTPGSRTVEQSLDNGARICLTTDVTGQHLTLDFSGTSGVLASNHNATEAIVYSTILYVLRLIANKPIPLNEGALAGVSVMLPRCFLAPDFNLPPDQCPAVAAGNTETSQRLTDTLLLAMSQMACGQGTMNNVLFGNDKFGYYETVGGGSGAGAGFDGTSAVHQHMTNTRITDAEELELRYPVRLMDFSIRKGSGGKGIFRGGDGAIRKLLFTEPVRLTFLGEHRKEGPYGRDGGKAGTPGRQYIVRKSGEAEQLEGTAEANLEVGDTFVLETPGGGGWGDQGEHPTGRKHK